MKCHQFRALKSATAFDNATKDFSVALSYEQRLAVKRLRKPSSAKIQLENFWLKQIGWVQTKSISRGSVELPATSSKVKAHVR